MKTEQENKLESNDHTFRMNKQSYIGTMVGGCKIESVLGVGGNGIVFLAHDDSLDRQVAIKLFPFGFGADENKVTRFIREAKSIAKIDHPNIVQIHSVGQEEDSCYIVMQYIKGKTLTQFIKEYTRLSILDSLYITLQVANALETVHHINMIHRDIKPSNVIIEENGRVRVMDFGLVRNTSEDATMITQEGVYQGTPAYSSPEQCETTNIDTRSDLYSLGVIMYEMLAGKVPHQGETPLATLKKIVSEDPPPLRDLNPDVPENIIAIQKKLLQKDREDRYSSATELLKDLEAVIEEIKNDPNQKSKAILRHSTSFKTSHLTARASSLPKVFKWVAIIVILTWLSFGVMHLIKSFQNNNTIPANIDNGQLTMAIYDFKNPTGNNNLNWLELGIPDMLMSSLAQYNNLNIINRSQVLWESGDKKARFDQSFRDKLVPLGTKIVIQGNIYQENTDVRIVVHVYDFAKNVSLGSIKEQGSVQDIFSVIDRLTKDLSGFLATQNLIVMGQSKEGTIDTDEMVASIQPCEQIFQKKFNMPMPASTTLTRIRSKREMNNSLLKKKRSGKKIAQVFYGGKAETDTFQGDTSLDVESLEKESEETKKIIDEAVIKDEKNKANKGKVEQSKNEIAPRLEREFDSVIDARNKFQETPEKVAEKASKKDAKTAGDSFGEAEGTEKALNTIKPEFKYETTQISGNMRIEEKEKLQDKDHLSVSLQVALPIAPGKSVKVTTNELAMLLPYYYQGIQFLEKQDFKKDRFDRECKNLKSVLSQSQLNPELLEKSYKEWKEKLSPEDK